MANKQKAKSMNFSTLGIPIGAILTLRNEPTTTCKTIDDKSKVEYQGKTYRISGLAKELMKTQISGYHAFRYNGVLLAKLGKKGQHQLDVNTAHIVPSGDTQPPIAPIATSQQVMPLPTATEAAVTAQEPNDDPEM